MLLIIDCITDFSVFFVQFLVYFTLKVGKLKAIHIMCKRDTESVKVASESVLSNGESRRYALDQMFAGEWLSPGGVYLPRGGYLCTPVTTALVP